jgi:acetyl-CoA carboxylase biotin carboxylase subunit
MLSKLIAYGETREVAIDRMLRALDEYVVGGIKTNISFFRRILLDKDFRAANIHTGYLERLLAGPGTTAVEEIPENLAALAAALLSSSVKTRSTDAIATTESRWAAMGRREAMRT